MPDYVVSMVDGMYLATDADEFAEVSRDAEQLLGRLPIGLEESLSRLVAAAQERHFA